MGLRCSLLGHDFGDVVVEREQDERGSEIVVTVRELRECRRCSAESIVSENTEVRRRRPEDDRPGEDESTAAESSPEARDEPEPLVEEAEASAAERERADGDAIILDDEPEEEPVPEPEADVEAQRPAEDTSATGGGDAPESESSPGRSDESTTSIPEQAAETDDARDDLVVAEDDSAEGAEEREPTDRTERASKDEWPDDPSASEPEPETSTTDETWPNHPDVAPDRSSSSATSESSESGFTFDESTEDAESEEATADPTSGIQSAGPLDLTGPPDGSLDGILHCPACGYSVAIARSSNRAGDICPDCHAGYLAEER